jgi:hypothetical protein
MRMGEWVAPAWVPVDAARFMGFPTRLSCQPLRGGQFADTAFLVDPAQTGLRNNTLEVCD